MLDSLSDRLGSALGDLRSSGRLSEDDINTAMREIRLALLEADVNFEVVKSFVATVAEGKVAFVAVTPGRNLGTSIEVTSTGLTATTPIIINPNALLRPGDPVEAKAAAGKS